MPSGKLSVIIPTYNRKEILCRTLEAYRSQLAQEEILEVLVADDGSSDGTESLVAESNERFPFPVRYLRQNNRGQASARNLGIREARGEIVLFGDDDIIPASNLVFEHMSWHRKYPEAAVGVLGRVAWSPEVHPTPFMKWLAFAGPLTDYQALSPGMPVDSAHFYSGNISLKLEYLRKNGTFDEDFRAYGYEDFELGYRLTKKGLRLLYNPDAVAYHYKYVSFADICRRAQLMDAAEKVLRTKEAWACHAEMTARLHDSLQRPIRKVLRRWLTPALALLKPLLDTQIPLPWIVYRWLYHYYGAPRTKPGGTTIRNAVKALTTRRED